MESLFRVKKKYDNKPLIIIIVYLDNVIKTNTFFLSRYTWLNNYDRSIVCHFRFKKKIRYTYQLIIQPAKFKLQILTLPQDPTESELVRHAFMQYFTIVNRNNNYCYYYVIIILLLYSQLGGYHNINYLMHCHNMM